MRYFFFSLRDEYCECQVVSDTVELNRGSSGEERVRDGILDSPDYGTKRD